VHAASGVEAVVVLGCRVLEGGVPSAAASRRVARAAAAYRQLAGRPGAPGVPDAPDLHGVAPHAAAAPAGTAAGAAIPAAGPPLVVASGGRRWGAAVEAVVMADALTGLGVPRACIALELSSLTTVENARFSAELLRAAGLRRAVVVTCDFHAARALRSFAAYGVEAVAWPAVTPATTTWSWGRRLAQEACSELLDARLRAARPA